VKKARREEKVLERMIRKLKESGESRARLRDGCGDPDMKLYWRGQADAAEEIFEEIVQICADYGVEAGG
jgi:hypothetical protein